MTYPCTRYEMMVGMLSSSTTISFSWWPPLEVMPHPWEEVSASEEGAAWFAFVDLSPLEWESEAPESEVDGALT